MTLEEIYGNAKALVEDKTYQIGEISEKTGLQKTANGWVKPKSNKKESVKSEQINKTWSQSDVVKSVPNGWKKDDGVTTVPNGYVAITNGKSRFGEGGRETKIIKEEYFKKADNKTTKSAQNKKDAKAFAEKHYGDTKENEPKENNGEKKTKPSSKKSLKLPDEKSSFQTDVNRMKKLKKEDYKQYTIQLEKLHSKYPINKWKDLYNKTVNDSTCRITADTKIKVKNVVENKVKENA